MWFPKNKITKSKYTYGDRFRTLDGKLYTGPYFETSDGRYFNGETPSPSSYELFPSSININKKPVPLDQPTPTEKQYSRGTFNRYFLKDSSTGKIVEVNEKVYNSRLKDRYIDGVTIVWYLKGPIKDQTVNGVKFLGAESKNRNNTIKANTKLIGVLNYVRDFTKFVRL